MTFPAFLSPPTGKRANASRDVGQLYIASLESSSLIYSLSTDISSASTPIKQFEPMMPDTSALVGIGAIVLVSALASFVWATQVVPTSRTKLAVSKRQGDVKAYLDELGDTDDRQFEQWLFTDWLEGRNATAVAGQKKEPALPILKKAKWNSGDNPILAATALIMLGVTLASITERVSLLLT